MEALALTLSRVSIRFSDWPVVLRSVMVIDRSTGVPAASPPTFRVSNQVASNSPEAIAILSLV